MPRPEELPPNKTVEEEKTDLTLSTSELFESEPILNRRYSKMITHLINELAAARLELRDWRLDFINETPK